jgi:predicted permease
MNPTVAQSLPVLSMVMVGFVLKKINLIREGDGAVMSRFILNVTLPTVIFLAVSRANVEPLRLGLLAVLSAAVAVSLRFISGWVTNKLHLEPQLAGVIVIGSMVMNLGAVLFPIVDTVIGAEGVSRLGAFDLGNSLIASSYCYYLAASYGNKSLSGAANIIARVVKVPILWACVLGAVVNLSGLEMPDFFMKILQPVSAANTPLTMIALGTFLVFKFPRWKLMGLTIFLRMGIGFGLGQLLIFLFGLEGFERMAVGMGTAMPVGMVTLIYAVSEGLNAEFAAAIISLSIALGLIISPFLLLLY